MEKTYRLIANISTSDTSLALRNRARVKYWPLKRAHSRYFGHVQITFKPKNSSVLRQKNTKEIIIKHKGTRMFMDGEDGLHGLLQMTNLKNLGKAFQDDQTLT